MIRRWRPVCGSLASISHYHYTTPFTLFYYTLPSIRFPSFSSPAPDLFWLSEKTSWWFPTHHRRPWAVSVFVLPLQIYCPPVCRRLLSYRPSCFFTNHPYKFTATRITIVTNNRQSMACRLWKSTVFSAARLHASRMISIHRSIVFLECDIMRTVKGFRPLPSGHRYFFSALIPARIPITLRIMAVTFSVTSSQSLLTFLNLLSFWTVYIIAHFCLFVNTFYLNMS